LCPRITLAANDAYGAPNAWGVVGTAPRFRYTGQIAIPEAQLYYYKARLYDPGDGKFLQTDPVGDKSDLNLYAYVRGDPINAADPNGTVSCSGGEVCHPTVIPTPNTASRVGGTATPGHYLSGSFRTPSGGQAANKGSRSTPANNNRGEVAHGVSKALGAAGTAQDVTSASAQTIVKMAGGPNASAAAEGTERALGPVGIGLAAGSVISEGVSDVQSGRSSAGQAIVVKGATLGTIVLGGGIGSAIGGAWGGVVGGIVGGMVIPGIQARTNIEMTGSYEERLALYAFSPQ
jgi:RHS repeat-associated protein